MENISENKFFFAVKALIFCGDKFLIIKRSEKARGDSLLTGKQALVQSGGDNLLPMGLKATKFGVGLAATAQLAAGTPQAVKQWNDNRMGTNFDNQPTTSAPRVPSYANNGGATGDLVFALNNLRHGGMMQNGNEKS